GSCAGISSLGGSCRVRINRLGGWYSPVRYEHVVPVDGHPVLARWRGALGPLTGPAGCAELMITHPLGRTALGVNPVLHALRLHGLMLLRRRNDLRNVLRFPRADLLTATGQGPVTCAVLEGSQLGSLWVLGNLLNTPTHLELIPQDLGQRWQRAV